MAAGFTSYNGSSRRDLQTAVAAATIIMLFVFAGSAGAHFGVIVPGDDIVDAGESRSVGLRLMFMHPFEGTYMDMARPAAFGVRVQGRSADLAPALRAVERSGRKAWTAEYMIERPGDHVFFMEPAPYFEPAEESFIVHYTKVIVHALGMESGWDEPLGLRTEIVPLTRPYGLWTGNVFRGQVTVRGDPLPHAEVEIEPLAEGALTAPAGPFVTQVVKTDASGVFSYGLPHAGWWGFAALSTDERKLRHTDGQEYPVELGAVLWVHARDME